MTQIGINNFMIYTNNDEIKLCKISQTYPNSKLVDIICIDEKKFVGKIDYASLKPIEASKDVIEAFGFSIKNRQNEPRRYGHPANVVFDLVYKDNLSWIVVMICDLYYLLLNDTKTISKTAFPLCVHHLQNMITSVGGDSVENEMSLISILKDKVFKVSSL